jgi:drug/metabolite transporter (DMT)-like permease
MARADFHRVPLKGIVYMLVAVLGFSAMDAAAKWLAKDYSVFQVALMSRLISPLLAVAIAMRSGGLGTLKTRHFGWHLFRAGANGATLLTFFGALKFLPLGDTVAITFVAPLMMSAMAVPMLGERVGAGRWIAIGIGFLGVLIITRPGSATFGWGALLALGAAFGDALGNNITRRMSVTESSHAMLFWSAILLLAVFGATMPVTWVTPQGLDWIAVLLIAVSGSLAQFCLAQAFRYGEVSLVAPLEYSALVWAALFGFWFWGEVLTWTVIAGVAIIIASSAYVAHREARARGAPRAMPDKEV